jgi:DNA-binding NtrC family response regulator
MPTINEQRGGEVDRTNSRLSNPKSGTIEANSTITADVKLQRPAVEYTLASLSALARSLLHEIEAIHAEILGENSDQIAEAHETIRGQRISPTSSGIDFYLEVERYETELIKVALRRERGSQARAARLLRMKPTTLNAKIKRYGLCPSRLLS